VVVQTAFVSDLVRNELSVVSGHDTLVDNFFLVYGSHEVSINELSHLHVVGEHVKRKVDALSNCNELVLFLILLAHWVHGMLVFSPCASLECSKRGDPFLKAVVHVEISHSEAAVLTVEEAGHWESLGMRVIKLQLVEQEGLIMILEEVELDVCVSEVSHAVKLVG